MKTIKPNPAQSDAMAKALEPFLPTVINPLLGELGVSQQKKVCVCKLKFRFDLIFSLCLPKRKPVSLTRR
jgi:hypothetical protein